MAQGKAPTIADVARRANVSIGTVSNVLSGTRYVSPERKSEVEQAITDLGYHPNRLARALVAQHTNTVGVVVPDIANPFFAELVRGAEDVLGEHDYVVMVGNSDNDARKEQRYLGTLNERRADGIMVVIAAASDAADVRSLASQMATVAVDRTVPGWHGDVVVGDNPLGMSLAVDHLAKLGHTELAFVNGDSRLSTASERWRGFTRAVEAAGLRVFGYSEGAFTFDSGYEQGLALLRAARRPTAVCTANDLLALGVLAAVAEEGVRVPEELSVVGYDDIAYARLASPSLTTVRQPAHDMGAAAARLLLDRLAGVRRTGRRLVVPPSLVVRASTASVGATR